MRKSLLALPTHLRYSVNGAPCDHRQGSESRQVPSGSSGPFRACLMTLSVKCGGSCAGRIIHGRMRRLAMSLSFDVATVLGIGTPNPDPIQPREGYVTLRVPVGISPRSLRQTAVGKELIGQDNTWY